MDNNDLVSVLAQISSDGRKNFRRGVPSPDAIRSFRARHRELAYRVSENVSAARLAAENVSHFGSLHAVLQHVCSEFPEFKMDPKVVWNYDETAVLGEYGKKYDATQHLKAVAEELVLLLETPEST